MSYPIVAKIIRLVFCIFFILISRLTVFAQFQEFDKPIYSRPLNERWELDSASRKGVFRITFYKPVYVTAGRWSSKPNRQPRSLNPSYALDEEINYKRLEAKFQLSLKTKLLQGIFGDKGDLWAAYTQVAHWQLYNSDISRAFRELNYEPELIFNYPVSLRLFGFDMKMAGVAFNHQSNGRDLPRSRSWNRIIFHAALQRENWQVLVRPWIRLKDEEDENPEMERYIGNGEFVVAYSKNHHQVYSVIRHPFDRLEGGSAELNFVFPIEEQLRFHIQFFGGYGETLIDYNHRQFTIGIGVTFIDW
ncbi:phospholipase A [Limibacter armeniacum]|uniref:phospholipase A n=1 Tax=Limibacter armeniacum TaxID=466084 RepID=UPI002FE50B91